jgi:FixJ family two-component response regulator
MSRVIFLDDNEDLRVVMVSLIESRLKISCRGLASFDEMLANADEILHSEIMILDLDLGHRRPSGMDAFKWLIENRYQGGIHFLTGHGHSHPLMKEAAKSGVRIWEKPIGSTQMLNSIAQKLASSEAHL